MNYCNCGCYLGFPISNYGKSLENNLIYDTSSNNLYRTQGMGLIEYKLNDLNANGIYPKASYFNQPIVQLEPNISIDTNCCNCCYGFDLWNFYKNI